MGTIPWEEFGPPNDPALPATCMSYDEASAFCEALTRLGRDDESLSSTEAVRLPNETQWEYVCRAGTGTRSWFGDNDEQTPEFAWCDRNARDYYTNTPKPAGQKPPNPWGFYDMPGNVWNWCGDVIPATEANPRRAVRRGFGFCNGPDNHGSAERFEEDAAFRGYDLGFRVGVFNAAEGA